MSFDATSIKRFAIVFAVFIRNSWKLRLRLVITLKTGIVAFPLTKTLFVDDGCVEIPPLLVKMENSMAILIQ